MRRPYDPSPITRRHAAVLLTAGAALASRGPRASADPIAPPPAPSPDPGSSVVDTQDQADRMTVPVMLDGRGPYAFIVDSASDRTVVSDSVAQALGLPSAGAVMVDSATGQGPADSVRVGRLQVGAREVRNVRAPVFRRGDVGGDGLLGIDALAGQDIVMDFRAKRMAILASPRREEPGDIVVTAKSRYGQLVLVDASMDGVDLYVVIDTGAEVSIANSRLRALADRRPRAPGVQGVFGGQVVSVSGVAADAQFDTLPRVRVGGVILSNLQVAYADVYAFQRFGLQSRPAMLLGMDVLRHFDRVSVDFKARQVRFLLPSDNPPIRMN